VHTKSVVITIVSAKAKYYEKANHLSANNLSEVCDHSCQSSSTVAMKTTNHKLPNYCTN